MLALCLILILAAAGLAAAAFGNSKPRGSKGDEAERRHPGSPLEDEAGLLQRRKDDNVGGEGG